MLQRSFGLTPFFKDAILRNIRSNLSFPDGNDSELHK